MQIKHLVRASDPLSSIHAAESTVHFAGGHKAIILKALKNGTRCSKELERCTGLTVVQIDRRMTELKATGAVQVVTLNDGAELVREGCRVYRLPVSQLELI